MGKGALILIAAVLVVGLAPGALGTPGCIDLDTMTFDKIVGGERPTFVRFDQEYPYGEENNVFETLALNSTGSPMLVCSVGISEYSNNGNADLAQRFGIVAEDKDKFPIYMMFQAGSKEGVTFTGSALSDLEMRQFIRKQGVWIGLQGCSDKGDKNAQLFMSTANKRKDILAETEKLSADEGKEGTTKWYSIVMKKVIEKGDGFINTEITRLQKVLEQGGESLKEEKVKLFNTRLNILASFK